MTIYRMQAYDSKMCKYFCIRFIDFILNCSSWLDYTNLFSPSKYGKNNKMILKYFQSLKRLRWKNHIALFVESIENLKNLKHHISFRCSKCKNEDKKKLKQKESIQILFLGLIENI